MDFVVVTGDLAFSGKRSEYELVVQFLHELVASVGVSSDRVFCVPGNHDIQRERSKLCFRGARHEIQSEADVYRITSDDEERGNLLRRQENFRAFEACFLEAQEREYTPDRLGYVSKIDLDDLRVAIVGVNSSWLSEGGASDEGKLLIGESQVKSAIDIAKRHVPHVVVGLQHHPFDLLQRFDRRPVQRRLEEVCDFVHCGHLHDPEVTEVVVESRRCLTIKAGASFESRGFRNTFTTVEFDPLSGRTDVAFIEYNPQTSAYEYESKKSIEPRIDGPCSCTVEELADAIKLYYKDAGGLSGYLSSLLLGRLSDVPIGSSGGTIVFVNWESIEGVGDAAFGRVAEDFRGVGRAIRLLHGRRSLADILEIHGGPIRTFASRLTALSEQAPVARRYLKMHNEASGGRRPPRRDEPLRHTVDLLLDLAQADDWDRARELAERTICMSEGRSRASIARILAVCLARSTEADDRYRAIELYSDLVQSEQVEAGDWGALATLKIELGSYDEAKAVIRDGIKRFRNQSHAFVQIGMRLVQESGDREFRNWLIAYERGDQGE